MQEVTEYINTNGVKIGYL